MTKNYMSNFQFAGRWLLIGLVVVFALLAFQTIRYIGLVENLAEWQFRSFGEYFPILTMAIPIGIFLAIYLLVKKLLSRRSEKPDAGSDETIGAPPILSTFAFWVGALGLVFTVSVAIQSFFLAGMDGKAATFDLGTMRPLQMEDGPVRLTGITIEGPIARSSDDFLFMRRTQYYAPIRSTMREDGTKAFNLFLQVNDTDPANIESQADGLFREGALPPEIAVMYDKAKYPTLGNAGIVFQSEASANRRINTTLAAAMLFSILALALAIWLRRRERKLASDSENDEFAPAGVA